MFYDCDFETVHRINLNIFTTLFSTLSTFNSKPSFKLKCVVKKNIITGNKVILDIDIQIFCSFWCVEVQ